MKTAEQIAEKLWEKYLHESLASRANFLAALKDYGEAVRDRAAGVCKGVAPSRENRCEWARIRDGAITDCATAISQMELP